LPAAVGGDHDRHGPVVQAGGLHPIILLSAQPRQVVEMEAAAARRYAGLGLESAACFVAVVPMPSASKYEWYIVFFHYLSVLASLGEPRTAHLVHLLKALVQLAFTLREAPVALHGNFRTRTIICLSRMNEHGQCHDGESIFHHAIPPRHGRPQSTPSRVTSTSAPRLVSLIRPYLRRPLSDRWPRPWRAASRERAIC
jgi:hypothetical protein